MEESSWFPLILVRLLSIAKPFKKNLQTLKSLNPKFLGLLILTFKQQRTKKWGISTCHLTKFQKHCWMLGQGSFYRKSCYIQKVSQRKSKYSLHASRVVPNRHGRPQCLLHTLTRRKPDLRLLLAEIDPKRSFLQRQILQLRLMPMNLGRRNDVYHTWYDFQTIRLAITMSHGAG